MLQIAIESEALPEDQHCGVCSANKATRRCFSLAQPDPLPNLRSDKGLGTLHRTTCANGMQWAGL